MTQNLENAQLEVKRKQDILADIKREIKELEKQYRRTIQYIQELDDEKKLSE